MSRYTSKNAKKSIAAGAVIVVSAVTFNQVRDSSHPAPEKSLRPLTYVAMGASDVVGIGADDPPNEAWVARIFKRLPPGSKFHRLGVEGSTVMQAAMEQLPVAEKAEADLVTVWLAVNDFTLNVPLDHYEHALDWVVGRSSRGKGRLFLGNIPDLTSTPAYDDEPREALKARLDQYNSAIGRVAKRNDAVLVDLYGASQAVAGEAAELVADDGFHPSSFGYQVLAEIFWNAISEDPVTGPLVDSG